MIERYDADGKLADDGQFDKDGLMLQFNDKGEVVEAAVSDDDLHKIAKASKTELENLDDDQVFLNDDDLDDLFEEVDVIPEDETEEEKEARLEAKHVEEERLAAEKEAKKLAAEDDDPTAADKLAKANLRIKELELGNPDKALRKEIPADDVEIKTVGDLKKLQDDIAYNKELDKQTYQKGYILSFYKEAYAENMTTAEADALFDFLTAPENVNYNQMRSNNGDTDGMINFNKIIRVYQKKTEKKLPLKKDKVDPKTLKHGNGKVLKTKKRVVVSKLDPAAQRFIEITGMDADEQAAALSGVSGIHSKGGQAI